MSEIDRKSGLLLADVDEVEDTLTTTTPGSVAAAISSALETADASIIDEESDEASPNSIFNYHNQHNHNHLSHDISTDQGLSSDDKTYNNNLINLDNSGKDRDNLVRKLEPLINFDEGIDSFDKCSSRTRPFLLHQNTQRQQRYLECLGRRFSAEELGSAVRSETREDCDHHHRLLTVNKNNADGNHEIREVSSACSLFRSPSSSSLLSPVSSSMADKEAGDFYCVSNSGIRSGGNTSNNSGKTIRDKPDNRETYQVSHCAEKSAADKTTSHSSDNRVFKPSSKVIDLPEKPSSLSTRGDSHDHQHHHYLHHHRNKDSKIPVGIAVAWQRLVTSTSTSPTTASAMTTKADGGSLASTKQSTKMKTISNSSSSKHQQPLRPSSASPLSGKTKGGKQTSANLISPGGSNNYLPSGNTSGSRNGHLSMADNSDNISISSRPLSACGSGEAVGSGHGGVGGLGLVPMSPGSPASPLSRPLPSSSVPPNMGFPTASSYPHHQYLHYPTHRGTPYLEYSYGVGATSPGPQRPFAVPSPLASPHQPHHPSLLATGGHGTYWAGVTGLENPSVPLLSPGIPGSPGGADYLQLSMQQQMHLHHHHHQQHLLASSRQSSLSLSTAASSLPSPLSAASAYNPYLPFTYQQQPDTSSLAAKNLFYDQYFHHHQQQAELLRQQQQQMLQNQVCQQQLLHHQASGISNSVNSANNSNNNNGGSGSNLASSSGTGSVVGDFDLLANNNSGGGGSSSGSNGSSHHHRAIPMQVASPRTSIPLMSPSQTGGIRTPTPTSTSSSSSAAAEISASAATTTTTTTAVVVTSSSCSTASPATTTSHGGSTTSTTATQQHSPSLSQSAAAGSGGTHTELSSSAAYSSCSSASSPSPSFLLLHQQQNPHLFTTSSAALSPKSLTSSTPSPVTVHDFNSGLNVVIASSSSNHISGANLTSATSMLTARKCATPSPISLTPRPLLSPFGSPFSPSPVPAGNNNNGSFKELVWREDAGVGGSSTTMRIKPIPINAHKDNLLTSASETSGSSSLTTTPISSPLLHKRSRQISVPTPLSSPSGGQKHDFKRLESLIERRDSESISPLVLIPQHSPATSTTSSILDAEESRVLLQGEGEERKIIPAFQVDLMKVEEDGLEDEEKVLQTDDDVNATEERKRLDSTRRSSAEKRESMKVDGGSIEASPAGNDSFKVTPFKQACFHHADQSIQSPSALAVKTEKVTGESGTKRESYPHDQYSNTINTCDADNTDNVPTVNNNNVAVPNIQHGGQGSEEELDDGIPDADDEITRNNVPESTLPFVSNNINDTSYATVRDSKNDRKNHEKSKSSGNDTTVINLSSFKRQSGGPGSEQNNKNAKDVSFTSGYSSSLEDYEEHKSQPPQNHAKTKSLQQSGGEKKRKSKDKNSIKSPSLKVNNKSNRMAKEPSAKKKVLKPATGTTMTLGLTKQLKETKPKGRKKEKAGDNKESSRGTLPLKLMTNKGKNNNNNNQNKSVNVSGDKDVTAKKRKNKTKTITNNLNPVQPVEPTTTNSKNRRRNHTHDFISAVDDNKKGTITKQRCSLKKKADRTSLLFQDGVDTGKRKKAKLCTDVKEKAPPKKVGKQGGNKEKKLGDVTKKRASKLSSQLGLNKQQHQWPVINPVTTAANNNYHNFANNDGNISKNKFPKDNKNTNFHSSPQRHQLPTMGTVVTSEHPGASVSGDIFSRLGSSGVGNSHSGTSGDHNSSLTISTTSLTSALPPQPVALILSPNSATPSTCPSQVTFLIASPTAPPMPCSSASSLLPDHNQSGTIRIPAYIPRSATVVGNDGNSGSPASFTSLMATDQLVGTEDNYTGPATLTLHRDVEATTYYQQPPPAITIQYHHSAPATPMMMEAMSPYGMVKPEENSLNLLATVAEEFGSREDLGKRLSIDGSCNSSIIGESPPMSPQKSPAYAAMTHNQQNMSTSSSDNPKTSRPINEQASMADKFGATPTPPASGKKSRKEKQKVQDKSAPKEKKTKKAKEKTSNSITVKMKKKQSKAGKKEKRSFSDSTAYASPVVLLKIPQIVLPTRPVDTNNKSAGKKKKETVSMTVKGMGRGVISNSKFTKHKAPKGVNKTSKSEITKVTKVAKAKKPDKNKERKSKKMSKLSSLSWDTVESLPLKDKTPSDNETKKKVKGEKRAADKKKKSNKLEGISKSSISLSLHSSSPSLQPLKLTVDHAPPAAISTTPSPAKEKGSKSPGATAPSCFYNPPERISAFAKQVIARRDSTATSPTKQSSINTPSPSGSPLKTSTSSVFFPVSTSQQQLLASKEEVYFPHHQHSHLSTNVPQPNSPTIKMPQLTPYDFELPPSSQPGTEEHSDDAVPKVVTKFPFSSTSPPAPPPLFPSVSEEKKRKERESSNHERDHKRISEQDKKKTDNITLLESRSLTSSNNGTSCSTSSKKKKKDSTHKSGSEQVDVMKPAKMKKKRNKNPYPLVEVKQEKKRRRRILSSDNEEVSAHTKKPNKSKQKEQSQSIISSPLLSAPSPPLNLSSPTIPRITITSATVTDTYQYSLSPAAERNSVPFSPLTPPPTAKSSSEDDDGVRRELSSLPVVSGSTPCSSIISSPSNLENEEEGEAETTENENENDFSNAWVADPMFAVSAIKLSNSNQPSDTSSVGGDDNSYVEIEDTREVTRKDNNKRKSVKSDGGSSDNSSKPPKLSLYNKQPSQQDVNNISSEQQQHERDRFLEVKSQLKAFVHFKPKQLTGNKKGHHNIKPCLKAEPVVRSQSEEDEDDDVEDVSVNDEDFELDLEVASLTTQNAPGKNNKNGKGSAATTTATSAAGKKPNINRNSLSYMSNSSSTKPPPLSTKEIMTKVFSRKVSPELGGERKNKHLNNHSKKHNHRNILNNIDADDEKEMQDDEEELLDIDEPFPFPTKPSHQDQNNPHISMSAAAAAVVVNNVTNLSSSSTAAAATTTTTGASAASSSAAVSTSLSLPATPSSSPKKSPKKRSARSSTTSSTASTKSSSRGNRGQALSATLASISTNKSGTRAKDDETLRPGKVELSTVAELVDEMRILTEIQGLFYTGRLNALQPPDVYGVTLDNERGAPPHLIFSAEEVLEKCLREKKPQNLSSGLRICAYWSPQYSGLYPGRVSSDFNPKFDPDQDLIPIEFDDGDTGVIKLKEIRLLSVNHPVREYDPNPLLTLEKKHRKRRHSSATGTSGGCTGDHDEPDCGEPYCAKVGKLGEEDDDDDDEEDNDHRTGRRHHSSKMLYWTWSGLGYKTPKSKKNRNKEFFHGIQRGNEVINVGDAALFISTGNERPFIGRVERFWESKGKKMCNVRWFYHPEEVKASAKRLSNLKYPGALFESPHIDENDVQTIAKKCDVLPFADFKQRLCSGGSPRLARLSMKSSSKPRDMYYVAGYYDPYTYNLTLKDLK